MKIKQSNEFFQCWKKERTAIITQKYSKYSMNIDDVFQSVFTFRRNLYKNNTLQKNSKTTIKNY